MATIYDRKRAIERDVRIQQFIIGNVRPTGKKLGSGAYGSVEELEINGTICAGKRVHEILLEEGNADVQNLVQKYVEECHLLSNMRHPHIVQFIGLCFLPDASLPLLIMERLLTSLDDLLENTPDIPLSLKRSILADVSKGLMYLHSHNPPIIHRDLSAKNVLLNSSMVAKISDMGNSRIVTIEPHRLAKTLSRIPGTLVYMPPEAFERPSRYGPSLDSFSFGNLALYTMIQVFPGDILAATYQNPSNRREVLARTEIERRRDYIDQLQKQLEKRHPMIQLVKECLDNDPEVRPLASGILQRLEEMKFQDPHQNLTKVEMMKLLRRRDNEKKSLQLHADQLQLDISAKGQMVMDLQAQIRILQLDNSTKTRAVSDLQDKNQVLQGAIQQMEGELALLHSQKRDTTTLLQASKKGDIGTLKRLLDAGVNTELQSEDGTTALMYASLSGQTEAVKLLSAKAVIDLQNRGGYTALCCAVYNGHLESARILVGAGANMELQVEDGKTALVMACEKGYREITELLLSAKAYINHQDNEGFTPLHFACQEGHLPVVSILLEHCADLHLTTKEGFTCLHYACQFGRSHIVSLLLDHFADLHLTSNKSVGTTPLMLACLYGHLDVVQQLIKAKANINQLSQSQGWTALMDAAANGNVEVVKKLIASGANIHMKNDNGNTAYDLARQNGHSVVCQVLN